MSEPIPHRRVALMLAAALAVAVEVILALVGEELDRPLEALAAAQRAVDLSERQEAAILDTLAEVYYTRGMYDEAIATDLGYRWDGVHVYEPGANLIYTRVAPELLRLAPSLAPIKVGIFPLTKKDGLPEISGKLYRDLRQRWDRRIPQDKRTIA